MKARILTALIVLGGAFHAQTPETSPGAFDDAADEIQKQLEQSISELAALRRKLVEEKVPLSKKLNGLEAELTQVRLDFQQTSRMLERRTLDLSNLERQIESRENEVTYLSGLLSEYIRNFESRLHIAELQRYGSALEEAKLAPESNLSDQEIFEEQAELLALSLERLEESLGGTRFEGTSVNPQSLVDHGTFVMVGPLAFFRSDDGESVGTVEEILGSVQPTQLAFADPADTEATAAVVATSSGFLPFDPTLGNAHKVAETEESLWEHIQKGGAVMVPIFAMAGAALLVALYKWLGLAFVRTPSRRQLDGLLAAVSERDEKLAKERVGSMKGPVGRMLAAGVEHLHEPRELIEEVMYETLLKTKLKLQGLLPFIAICAASVPLLGLLGTVTGIISTFKLITVFGSGDVKTLSGGISEALITTEFGLIVAIPSLLLHAFLSRKVRAIVGKMETAAIAFANQVSKTPFERVIQPSRPEEPGAAARAVPTAVGPGVS